MNRTLITCALAAWFLVSPRVGSPAPFEQAPPLSPDDLARLRSVRAWDITYTQTFAESAMGSGDLTGVNLPFGSYIGRPGNWSSSQTRQFTFSAAFTVSGRLGPSDCSTTSPSGCVAKYEHPATWAASESRNSFGGYLTDYCSDQKDKLYSVTSSYSAGGTREMTGVDSSSTIFGVFSIDHSVNPPVASASHRAAPFLAPFSQDYEFECYDVDGQDSNLPTAFLYEFEMFPYHLLHDPDSQGGDTQIRLEDGKFVIRGGLDWDAERNYFPIGVVPHVPATIHVGHRIVTSEWTVREHGVSGDVAVLSVEPVQSVFGIEPLVAGKDAVVKLELSHTFQQPTDAWVTVSIDQPGLPGQQFTERITLAVEEGVGPCALKRYYLPGSLLGMVPDSCATSPTGGSLASLGPIGIEPKLGGPYPYEVSVEVTPVGGEDENPSNDAAFVTRNVVDTQLVLSHVRLAPLNENAYGQMPFGEFDEAVAWTNRQTLAMFPVGSAGFFGDVCRDSAGGTCEHLGTPLGQCTLVTSGSNWHTCTGIHLDGLRAYQMATHSDPDLTRAVIVVPRGYFGYHGLRETPQSNPNAVLGRATSGAVFIAADAVVGRRDGSRPPVGPHELSHSLRRNSSHTTQPPNGYWVGCTGVHELCEVPSGAQNLMSPSLFGVEPPSVWLDAPTYAELLAELKIELDPTILVVTGTIRRGGSIEILGLDELSSGTVTRSYPDELAVETLNDRGEILSRHSGIAFTEDGFGLIMLRIEYPLATARLRFTEGERVLLMVDPVSLTLRDVVTEIPDHGFVRNPRQLRKALLNKVDAFTKQLETGTLDAALEKLRNDIRKHAQDWLLDLPTKRPGIESDRQRVLAQIERAESRLQARLAGSH